MTGVLGFWCISAVVVTILSIDPHINPRLPQLNSIGGLVLSFIALPVLLTVVLPMMLLFRIFTFDFWKKPIIKRKKRD